MNYIYKKMNQRGFTLIELLIVISIIAFLASTFFPTLNEARAKGDDARRIASVKNIQTQIADQTNIGQTGYDTIFSTGETYEKLQQLIADTGANPSEISQKADHDTFALVFPLKKGGFWCVDAEGKSQYATGGIVAMVGPYSCAQAVDPVVGPGAIDQTWTMGNPNGPVYHGAMQADGKILLSGDFTLYNGVSVPGFVRLNTDGTVDTTFTSNAANIAGGIGSLDAITVQSDGKILIGGLTSSLKRLNTDGTLDYDLGPTSVPIYDIAVQSDGFIIAARGNSGVGRFHPGDGSRTDYNNFTPASYVVRQVAVLPSDGIVAAGSFTRYTGIGANNIVWMNQTGSYAGNGGGGFDVNTIKDIFIDKVNQNLYMIGGFTTYSNNSTRGVVRTDYSGNYDASFDSSTGFDIAPATPLMMGISKDTGYPVVVGEVVSYENTTIGGIVRITNAGDFDVPSIFEHALDPTAPGFQSGIPYVILIQSDGKMVVAGSFATYRGVNVGKVIRINP